MQDLRRRAGTMPVKDHRATIKTLALASGHDRHTTAVPERALSPAGGMAFTKYNRYKFLTA
jgi:hypothetical protein